MDRKRRGVVIEGGAHDWQIFQQDRKGVATIGLRGRWIPDQKLTSVPKVLVRVVREDCYETVTQALDWTAADTRKNGTWSIELRNVPRGGLYRIETVLKVGPEPPEWCARGDMVHHVGVGDIWVITGQSNAAGYGRSPLVDGPELGVHMFHARGEWKLATHPLGDSTESLYTPNREGTNASQSPWLAFGKKLKNALGYPIGLIPASLGGSAMWMWKRGRKREGEFKHGFLFDNMLRYIEDAGGTVRGAVWYQGESDTDASQYKHYVKRFRGFVADLRKALGVPKLPVLTVQLNRCSGCPMLPELHDAWDMVREIQRQLARSVPGVTVASTLDMGLADGVHNSSPANVVLGERMAACALGFVHGHDVKYLCPDLADVKKLSATRIELAFDNVDGLLKLEDLALERFPFAVRDTNGDVPVKAWTIRGNKFILKLVRPIEGKAIVAGGHGVYPNPMAPVDTAGYRPMLGFRVELT